MTLKQGVEAPPTGWRFRIGIGFFVLAWVCPLFIPLVTASSLSGAWKNTLYGFLIVGGPEICSFASIAFFGKEGFDYIKSRIFAFFKSVAPQARVSRTRYRIGLVMWALLAVFGVFIYYAPDIIPGYDENRIVMNLVADFLFIVSFFVLGGEFWDKFRALFIYDAKVQIPEGRPS
jgi:hypothetical protein